MAMLTAVLVACVFLYSVDCVAPSYVLTINDRPIIGVLSQELSHQYQQYPGKNTSYIAASYVKFLESAGARVVPIKINQPKRYYENIVNSVNGLLFPGGAAKFTKRHGYAEAGSILYDLAVTKNLQGYHFPVLGTCLGFELLTFITAKQKNILTRCSAENIALPLEFKEGYRKSPLYRQAPDNVIKALKTQNSTANFHVYCVTEKRLRKSGLDRYWSVLSLNHDVNGLEFVSSVAHRQYPFYGLQFHPEKNAFEWPRQNIPHFPDDILVGQYFGNFLVNEARKNGNHFATSREEEEALIYNYVPVHMKDSEFEQIYFFSN